MSIAVLLADDHVVLREGLRMVLEAQPDIKVIGDVGTGCAAVQQVAELAPDVVVMDIAMPEMNGIEATRQIHELHPAVQIIILSMHDELEHIFRALHAGARGYLLKQSASAEVVAAVRTVRAGHRYLSCKISDRVIDDYIQQRTTAEVQSPLARLSPREQEVLQLIVSGKANAEIAALLSVSTDTVKTYRSRVMRKLEIDDLPSLVKFAILHGLVPLE